MNKSIYFRQVIGFVFVCVTGTFLHFLYELTGRSLFAAPFSGVNESTWEHMKLIFFPMLVFALIEWHFSKDIDGFMCVKLVGTLTALALIPVIYYTYNGAFGKSHDWFNISVFYISAAAAFLLEAKLFKSERTCKLPSSVAIFILCCISASFVIFTFTPPRLPLFEDPITGLYGLL